MAVYVRRISEEERRQLRAWLYSQDKDLRHRVLVICLSNQGYTIPEIAKITNHHPTNLRPWIRRFNKYGPEGLKTRHGGGPRTTIGLVERRAIVQLAREGNKGRQWTLHGLAKAAAEQGIVDSISHEWVRQVLHDAGVDWRHI